MKKFYTLAAALLCTMAAMATEYTGQLTVSVTVDGETNFVQQETAITLNKNGENYDFSLKNFILQNSESEMPVGNINIVNEPGTTSYGFTNISYNKGIHIAEGDDSQSMWYGPYLGEVPLNLFATFNDQVLSVSISIGLQLGEEFQTIQVYFTGTNPEAAGGNTDELQAKIDELTAENNQLKADLNDAVETAKAMEDEADELAQANDELKAANDELTLKNEELTAANAELQEQIDKLLNAVKGDVNNDGVVNATDIATVVNIIAGIEE